MTFGSPVLLVPILGAVLVLPGLPRDNNKDKDRHSRSAEWDRRTDHEWRRYTDEDGRRRSSRDTWWRSDRDNRRRALDTNGDGVVTRGEWRGNDTSFSRQDRDRDGVITERDREPARRNRAHVRGQRDHRFRSLDRNGDGIISQEEFSRR